MAILCTVLACCCHRCWCCCHPAAAVADAPPRPLVAVCKVCRRAGACVTTRLAGVRLPSGQVPSVGPWIWRSCGVILLCHRMAVPGRTLPLQRGAVPCARGALSPPQRGTSPATAGHRHPYPPGGAARAPSRLLPTPEIATHPLGGGDPLPPATSHHLVGPNTHPAVARTSQP